jgi:hypothetical protein
MLPSGKQNKYLALHTALMKTIHKVGVMKDLMVDGTGEMNEKKSSWGQIVKEFRIDRCTIESHSP